MTLERDDSGRRGVLASLNRLVVASFARFAISNVQIQNKQQETLKWFSLKKNKKKKQANKPTKKNEQTKHYWLGSIFFWAANSSAWIDIHWIYHVSIGLILIEPTDRSCWLITQ